MKHTLSFHFSRKLNRISHPDNLSFQATKPTAFFKKESDDIVDTESYEKLKKLVEKHKTEIDTISSLPAMCDPRHSQSINIVFKVEDVDDFRIEAQNIGLVPQI